MTIETISAVDLDQVTGGCQDHEKPATTNQAPTTPAPVIPNPRPRMTPEMLALCAREPFACAY